MAPASPTTDPALLLALRLTRAERAVVLAVVHPALAEMARGLVGKFKPQE